MNQFLARRLWHRLHWIELLIERFSRLHRYYDDGHLVFYILERRKKEKKKKGKEGEEREEPTAVC